MLIVESGTLKLKIFLKGLVQISEYGFYDFFFFFFNLFFKVLLESRNNYNKQLVNGKFDFRQV